MDCKPCRRNRVSRDGGSMGLCWEHIRRTCSTCNNYCNGEGHCASCAHASDLVRWTARAELRIWDTERDEELYQAKKEKLIRSKFLAHEAVEILFQSVLGVVQAIWGRPPEERQRPLEIEIPRPHQRVREIA